MLVPYNTGKVKIGLAYERPNFKAHMSADACHLQRALLKVPQDRQRRHDGVALYLIGVVCIVGVTLVLLGGGK